MIGGIRLVYDSFVKSSYRIWIKPCRNYYLASMAAGLNWANSESLKNINIKKDTLRIRVDKKNC